MSTKQPRSAAFKLKVALAALSGKETIVEICQRHQVAESLVHKWKKQLLEHGASIFSPSKDLAKEKRKEQELSRLYEKLGQLTVERDFLKKSLGE